jgi:hypothetical protein
MTPQIASSGPNAADTRVLVMGLGRAGKSWIGDGLALADDVEHVDEPDNHFLVPFALRAKRQLGQRFYPEPDSARATSDYEALWASTFRVSDAPLRSPRRDRVARLFLRGDGDRIARRLGLARGTALSLSGERDVPLRLKLAEALASPMEPSSRSSQIVASSAYAQLAAPWIASRFDARIVVVKRDLESLFATWVQQGWITSADPRREIDPRILNSFVERIGIVLPAGDAPPAERAAWLIGFLAWHLERVEENLGVTVVRYEDFVANPHESFAGLAGLLGLGWSDVADRALDAREQTAQRRATLRPGVVDERLRSVLHETLGPFALA